jgi:hypothetical protein
LERLLLGSRPQQLVDDVPSRLIVDDARKVIRDLEDDGASHRVWLAQADVDAIFAFANARECTTRAKPVRSFHPSAIATVNAERPRDVIAAYYFDQVRDCPEIAAIETDPLIQAIAKAYIGSTPHHIRTRMWWSFPGKRVEDADLHAAAQDKFHFDLNDFRTVKFFFYLTDVDRDAGPHAYISGSHRMRKLSHQYSYLVGHREQELRDYYGNDRFVLVTGKAGTGFVEDPFVFHVGMTCNQRPRLLLEIEFGPYLASESYRYGILG